MNSELKKKFVAGLVILEFKEGVDRVEDLQLYLNQFPSKGIPYGMNRYYIYRPFERTWRCSDSVKELRNLASATLPFHPLAYFLTKEAEPVEISDYNVF